MSRVPSPEELGLPSKYKKWRANQEDAILQIDECRTPTLGLMLPPGAGKSGIYMGWATWRKKRVIVLTSSKVLQDQLYRDFAGLGLTDIRGQSNYDCDITGGNVADAPCHGGYECPAKKNGECGYFALLRRAKREQLLSSNYSFWFHNRMNLGDFDAVIFDEAHNTFDQISKHVRVSYTKKEVEESFHRAPIADWKAWAGYQKSLFESEIKKLGSQWKKTDETYAKVRVLKDHLRGVEMLAAADPKTFIYTKEVGGWSWECVWPGAHRHILMSNSRKFVFVSGTITRRLFGMLGFAPEEYTFKAYPSTFPPKRRPIHILPAPRMNFGVSPTDLTLWIRTIDNYLGPRADRRGLIHTGSYDRAELLATRSAHRGRMIVPMNRKGLPEAMSRFLATHNGILVSPSIIEGHDFPYEAALYQIIAKLAFGNPNDPVNAERLRQDDQYLDFMASLKIMQAAGRVSRAEDDFGETAIADGSWQHWFWRKAKHHFPSYFHDAVIVTTPDDVPLPPPNPFRRVVKKIEAKPKKVLDSSVPAPLHSTPHASLFISGKAANPKMNNEENK